MLKSPPHQSKIKSVIKKFNTEKLAPNNFFNKNEINK